MPDTTSSPPLMQLHAPTATALHFRSMSASEEMSRLFEFNVLAVTEDASVDASTLLGTGASASIELPAGGRRHFHGIVAAAGLEGSSGKALLYRLVLRPSLWLLTRRSDSRIFQEMTVVDIVKKVLENYTCTVRWEVQGGGASAVRNYCVQYRETDFNFISRLFEEEGIYYYFVHEQGQHTAVFCDAMSSHQVFTGSEEIEYRETSNELVELQSISEWRHNFELPPSKVTLTDYDYLKPSTSLLLSEATTRQQAAAALEFYDQPGDYLERSDGSRYARLRMDELDARFCRVSGSSSSVRGIAAGYRFTLKNHVLGSENVEYVVVSTQIEAQYAGYESGLGESHFMCRFTAIRGADIFRPERITPKPVVPGPQTAVVTGPSGEEIYTDVHGRVKVQFHWDRIGQKNENSSCWLRVASQWAGKAWGMISLPRIGQEVVVDFLEGDPDRPLVTGRVYNAEQITPYLLPERKTVSTIKSRSSKEGVASNFNELAFEDDIGNEFIRLHAEKDLVEIVKNDAHREVMHDQFLKITNDLTEEIGHDVHRKVVSNVTTLVQGKADTEVQQDVTVKIGAKLGVKADADVSVDTGASLSLKSGSAGDVKIGANLGVEASANVHIKGGANVVIEAGAALTLKGAMINIEASGIVSINGSLVKINSGGGGGSGGGASPQAPGSPGAPNDVQPLTDRIQAIADELAEGR